MKQITITKIGPSTNVEINDEGNISSRLFNSEVNLYHRAGFIRVEELNSGDSVDFGFEFEFVVDKFGTTNISDYFIELLNRGYFVNRSEEFPFFAELTPFNSVIQEVSNGAGANTGNIQSTFTPEVSGGYVFEYSGEVQQGGGGISIDITPLGTDLFVASPATGDEDGSRLTLTRQENFTPPIPLTAGVTYHITQWAGGGGIILNHTVSTGETEVDRFGVSTDANNALTIGTDGLVFFNPNVLNLVKGSATNITGTSPANSGEVIQFTFTVPTDDTYTLTETLDSITGGVTAQHGAGLGISLTPPLNSGVIAGFDVFSTNSNRLTEGTSPRSHTLDLIAGVTYYATAYPGANQTVTNYCLNITGGSISDNTITNSVINGINIREHSDGYIEMWGTDTTGGLNSRVITFPNGITMLDTSYKAHCNVENATANRFVQIGSRTTTTLTLRPHNTASDIIWSVEGYRQ